MSSTSTGGGGEGGVTCQVVVLEGMGRGE